MTQPTAKMADVQRVLAGGGFVRFTWVDCRRELIDAAGVVTQLDGRTFDVLQTTPKLNLVETRSGSTEARDLVIEWRPR